MRRQLVRGWAASLGFAVAEEMQEQASRAQAEPAAQEGGGASG